jgi:hypothetical protein
MVNSSLRSNKHRELNHFLISLLITTTSRTINRMPTTVPTHIPPPIHPPAHPPIHPSVWFIILPSIIVFPSPGAADSAWTENQMAKTNARLERRTMFVFVWFFMFYCLLFVSLFFSVLASGRSMEWTVTVTFRLLWQAPISSRVDSFFGLHLRSRRYHVPRCVCRHTAT